MIVIVIMTFVTIVVNALMIMIIGDFRNDSIDDEFFIDDVMAMCSPST